MLDQVSVSVSENQFRSDSVKKSVLHLGFFNYHSSFVLTDSDLPKVWMGRSLITFVYDKINHLFNKILTKQELNGTNEGNTKNNKITLNLVLY